MRGLGFCGGGARSCLPFQRCRCKHSKAQFKPKLLCALRIGWAWPPFELAGSGFHLAPAWWEWRVLVVVSCIFCLELL